MLIIAGKLHRKLIPHVSIFEWLWCDLAACRPWRTPSPAPNL